MPFPKLSAVLIGLLLFSGNANAQKSSYSSQCELVHDFLRAVRTEFGFSKRASNSTIALLDVDGTLNKCPVDSLETVRIIIINSGVEVEKIRKHSVLSLPSLRKDLFYLSKKIEGKKLGCSLFDPYTNEIFYWTFSIQNKRYIFQKKGGGLF